MATLRLIEILDATSHFKEHHLVDEEDRVLITWTEEHRAFSPAQVTMYAGPKDANQIFCTIRRHTVNYNGLTQRGNKFLHNQKKTGFGKAFSYRRSFYTPDGKEYQWKADRWKENDKKGHLGLLPVPRNPHDQPIAIIDVLPPEVKKAEKEIPKARRKVATRGIIKISTKTISPYADYDPTHALVLKGQSTPLLQSAVVALACIIIRESDDEREMGVGLIKRSTPLTGVGFTLVKGDGVKGLHGEETDEGFKPIEASGFTEAKSHHHVNSITHHDNDKHPHHYSTPVSAVYTGLSSSSSNAHSPEVHVTNSLRRGWKA